MKSPIVRNSLAAVAGYVVMFAVAFVLYSGMWAVLGADGSFAPGSWQVSGAWISASIVLGLIVSVAGGFACSKLSASRGGVAILIGLVVIVGILSAIPDEAVAAVRPDAVSMFDAMSAAQQPTWLLLLNPVLGVIGVALGARLDARS